MWIHDEITHTIQSHLAVIDAQLTAEGAVYGLDSFNETLLHPYILQSFTTTNHASIGEVYYPSCDQSLPANSERDRADCLLLPNGNKRLYDPVDAHKQLARASGTLFESVAELPAVGDDECTPGDAYWIEIKVIPQFRYVDGVPRPNSRYANELLQWTREDVIKLASDPLIRHAGVLLVVFNQDQQAGPHDVAITVRELLNQDLPVGIPSTAQLGIQDRCGNAWCTLGLIPVRL
jgi:hypothetical protein